MRVLFLLSLIGLGPCAFAFPEMVRAGYQNCTSCHVSPTGGGALTKYGRSMTSELLSVWSYKGEENLGHGLLGAPPEWLQMGGDMRWIHTYSYNEAKKKTSNNEFLMETDIEPALKLGKLSVVGSLGVVDGTNRTTDHGQFLSRHHYAMYSLSEETYVRTGKYEVPFGIYQPNHTVVTRDALGFGDTTETYNLEAGYIGERFNAIATVNLGRFDDSAQYAQTGNGASINLAYNLFESYKIGYSLLRGSMAGTQRWLTGPYSILGFTKRLVLLSEFYYQWQRPTDDLEQKGPAIYNRLQYEFVQGVHGYVETQFAKNDMGTDLSEVDAYAAGFNFYPRPHLELLSNVGKFRQKGTAYSDIAWIQAHYYF